MNHQVIAMRKHPGSIKVGDVETRIALPNGYTGMLFCFESKKAARQFWGKNVELVRYEEVKKQ